jgi:hypothetical protein
VTGGTTVFTFTVAVAVTLPLLFVAVNVYVVVAVGVTSLVVVPVTTPIPWLIDSEVAPVTLHDNVVDPPTVTDVEEAVNEEITGAAAGGGGVGAGGGVGVGGGTVEAMIVLKLATTEVLTTLSARERTW